MPHEARATTTPTPMGRDPIFWGVLTLGFALRLGALLRYPELRGLGDEIIHYTMGRLVEWFGTGALGQWAPVYDVGLGLLSSVFGPHPFVPKLAQVLVSTGTIAGIYALARAAGGGLRAARIAAALCAIDPSLIAFTHYLFTETLFIALLVASACALFVPEGPRSGRQLLLAGLAFGLATLTRSVGLYFLVLWAGFAWLRGRRGEARDAAIVFAVTLAVVLPWTARNFAKYDAFLLVDGTLGRTAYLAFSERFYNFDLGYVASVRQGPNRQECVAPEARGAPALPSFEELLVRLDPSQVGLTPTREAARIHVWRARRYAVEDLAAVQACEVPRALAFARANPGTTASHIVRRFYAFWGPNSPLLRAVAGDVYLEGPLSSASYPFFKWIVVGLHLVVLAGAILAFGSRKLAPVASWMGLFIVYYTGVHVVAVASSRYRLPIMPWLTVLCAVWLANPRRPEGRTRAIGVGLGLVATVALCLHYAWVRLP